MAERKLESQTVVDRRFFFYDYVPGISLMFVSGPEITRDIKPGAWLDLWAIVDGKRRFTFGPKKVLMFATKEAATAAQMELKTAVDVITKVVEG
jgi:hypothetical protein